MEAMTLTGLILMAALAYATNRIQLEEQQASSNSTPVLAHSFYSQLTGMPDNQEELN